MAFHQRTCRDSPGCFTEGLLLLRLHKRPWGIGGLLYGGSMQTPEHQLSPTERRMLTAIAAGNQDEATSDFVAFQRLKAFGFITMTPEGRPTITDEGKQALRLAQT